ncbi:uncharacterized protein V1510DRAFT_215417 [Dipodascopsis tothii]|uniref:uncharacterized protein n=1 Tax=Dipodascopsis tothii TaxID=44089 RepID=UPI0034CFC94A
MRVWTTIFCVVALVLWAIVVPCAVVAAGARVGGYGATGGLGEYRAGQARGLPTPSRTPHGLAAPDEALATYDSHTSGVSEQRRIGDWDLAGFLLVSTVDGSLHACRRNTGERLWTLEGQGSAVKAAAPATAADGDHEDITWIVEPLEDGSLYYFTMKHGLQRLPVSIKQLVLESPFAILGDDKIYTGSRETVLYAVDARTGKIVNVYGSGSVDDLKCRRKDLQELDEDDNDWISATTGRETFLLGRTEYKLQIHSKDDVVWNVSYATWGPNNMDADLIQQHATSPDHTYVSTLHDGTVVGFDSFLEHPLWSHTLGSPAISVFDVFTQPSDHTEPYPDSYVLLPQPKMTNPRFTRNTDGPMSTFVNRTAEWGWYALSESNFPFLVKMAPPAAWSMGGRNFYDSRDVALWLVGVHDGRQMTNAVPLLGIEAPSASPQIGGSHLLPTLPPAPEHYSIHLRAVVDLAMALPILLVAYLIYRYDYFRRLWFSKSTAEEETSPITRPLRQTRFADDIVSADMDRDSSGPSDDARNNDDGQSTAMPPPGTVKKRKRGSRGGRKKAKELSVDGGSDGEKSIVVLTDQNRSSSDINMRQVDAEGSENEGSYNIHSLQVTDTVLGYGSHGTVVYKGLFENREVAVKRMLVDFYDVASHEVSLLQVSDDHPNVIRYYCKQESQRFLYIALELCPATLQDVIEKSSEFSDLVSRMDPPKVLYQIANGLQHLHSLKIVHRDIKPQNILVTVPQRSANNKAPARLLISDFGLCKKLEGDQSSFRATTAQAAGTSGWRAPELLVDDDDSPMSLAVPTQGSQHSTQTGSTSEPAVIDSLSNRRATRAIDIFSLGCVFYYVLSNGTHPFGDKYMREANIIKNDPDLEYLDALGYQGIEAKDLIRRMLDRKPKNRPSATDVLTHPYFWPAAKRLDFLLDVSDRFEVERRDPPSELLCKLENGASDVLSDDWYKLLDKGLIENLGKYRKYHGDRMLDLLRALRNKKHHYQDLPPNVQASLGPVPDGFLTYFSRRFPNLLLHIYYVVRDNLRGEPNFQRYFNLESEGVAYT